MVLFTFEHFYVRVDKLFVFQLFCSVLGGFGDSATKGVLQSGFVTQTTTTHQGVGFGYINVQQSVDNNHTTMSASGSEGGVQQSESIPSGEIKSTPGNQSMDLNQYTNANLLMENQLQDFGAKLLETNTELETAVRQSTLSGIHGSQAMETVVQQGQTLDTVLLPTQKVNTSLQPELPMDTSLFTGQKADAGLYHGPGMNTGMFQGENLDTGVVEGVSASKVTEEGKMTVSYMGLVQGSGQQESSISSGLQEEISTDGSVKELGESTLKAPGGGDGQTVDGTDSITSNIHVEQEGIPTTNQSYLQKSVPMDVGDPAAPDYKDNEAGQGVPDAAPGASIDTKEDNLVQQEPPPLPPMAPPPLTQEQLLQARQKRILEREKRFKEKKNMTDLDKFWKAVIDNPSDFTGWTYLLQYVEQQVLKHLFFAV